MPGENGTTLSAKVTASAKYTKTFKWTISKTVSPDSWDLFPGDEGVSQYKIQVIKDSGTDLAVVSGQVCVTNGPFTDPNDGVPTENLKITVDLIRTPNTKIVTGQLVDVSAMKVLVPNQEYCYDYSIIIPSAYIVVGATYKVTAHVTITNHSGHLGQEFGPNPSNDDNNQPPLILPPITLVHDVISITDTNGRSFSNINKTQTLTYEKTFTCADSSAPHYNTATIIYEGGDLGPTSEPPAETTVKCYALNVDKDAYTTYKRTYSWTIDKTVSDSNTPTSIFTDPITLTMNIGDTHPAYYKVAVAAKYDDSDFKVSGTIYITNSAPISATIVGVTDNISGIGNVPVTPNTFPVELAGGPALYTYEADLPNADTRINTATATIQNYRYFYLASGKDREAIINEDGTSKTTSFNSDGKTVAFTSNPTTEVDRYIQISDSKYPYSVGSADATDDSTWYPDVYSRDIGLYAKCGKYVDENTATLITSDTKTTVSDKATVNVIVPCGTGCTHTIGYWKTHAGFTGNNPDLVTKKLPIVLGLVSGAKSIAVTDAKTAVYYLDFSGDASNGINKLYAQLLGAKLNHADGASLDVVASTITAADTFLATHNAADWSSLSKADRNNVLTWMTKLDNYNNGLTPLGPPHCSESGEAEPIPPQDENVEVECDCGKVNINVTNSQNVKIIINGKKECESC